jgi:UDPglucose--hexose-1-phosphate uridylyltransferase
MREWVCEKYADDRQNRGETYVVDPATFELDRPTTSPKIAFRVHCCTSRLIRATTDQREWTNAPGGLALARLAVLPPMLEMRQDPLTGRWVIIAENRAQRPREFSPVQRVRTSVRCPFCEGNEHETPREVAAYRQSGGDADGPGWQVRVVPNKYPALVPDPSDAAAHADSLFVTQKAIGVHEVIIETPEHVVRTTDLTDGDLTHVVQVYRDRFQAAGAMPDVCFGLVFKNVGPEAGATMEHAHSQLIALPVIPAQVRLELNSVSGYYRETQRCLFCRMIDTELKEGRRLVAQTDDFVALCPFAARVPYETWVMPRRHMSRFEALGDSQLGELAALLRQVSGKIDAALGRPAYNYTVRSAPFDSGWDQEYHWRIVVFPRLTNLAGFELGTDCYINPIAPEKAAQELQIAKI